MRWILEMTPKLPLPMLLTRRYLSISEASAKSIAVGVDAPERFPDMVVEPSAEWRLSKCSYKAMDRGEEYSAAGLIDKNKTQNWM